MKTVSLTEINSNFDNYLQQLNGEPSLITKNDRPIAAIHIIVESDD